MTSVGWASVVRAATEVTGWDEDTVRACAVAIGDLGEAVSLLLPARPRRRPVDRGGRGLLPRPGGGEEAGAASRRPCGDPATHVGRRGQVPAEDPFGRPAGRRGRDDRRGGHRRGVRRRPRSRRSRPARLRRHRRDRRGRQGRTPRRHSLPALPPDRLHAGLADRDRGGDRGRACGVRGRGQVRRHPRPRPQGWRPRDSLFAHARRRHASVSRRRRRARGGAGPLPAGRRDRRVGRRAAGLVLPAPAPPRAQGPGRRAARRDPGGFHRLRLPGGDRTRLSSRLPGASAAGVSRVWPRRPGCGARACTPPRPRRSSNPSSPRRGPEATRASC